jgi:hypothetical protein
MKGLGECSPLFFGAIFLGLFSFGAIFIWSYFHLKLFSFETTIPSALSAHSTAKKPRSGSHSLCPSLSLCAFLRSYMPAQITCQTALPLKNPCKDLSSALTASFYVS